MSLIGFELVSNRALSVLPNYTFSMSILWNKEKLPSSIGKDIYHESGLILPNKRIAATGRMHYLSENTINRFDPFQTAPCLLIKCPSTHPVNLQVEIVLPREGFIEPIDRTTILYFLKKEKGTIKRIPLYFDSSFIQKTQPKQLYVDVSFILPKHCP
ncbi:hypothetical protein F9802_13795 [Bacillus aerolatus]|uniref:Uncharacterized protein n=1 Tax=Bacillus aerolatus TaxID=2653354 RepID=A0A6I1FHQ3_9BACI|nr:hypothetical protein [Bacillus aerolatus]KAB7705603.1 hypothetical protein F9802_13795 [Bacillus aerolatus]